MYICEYIHACTVIQRKTHTYVWEEVEMREGKREEKEENMAVSQNMHQDLSLMSFITLKKTSSICRLRRKDDTGGRRRQKHQGLTVIRTPSDFT